MKNALAIVLRGFLLGVGFCVAAGIAYSILNKYWMSQMQEESGSMANTIMQQSEDAIQKSVAITSAEKLTEAGRTWIVGSIKNNGSTPIRGVQLEAELFLKGKFVDQYSTYVSGSIAPGESRNFKIACGCKDSPAPDHDDFKVHVRGGY